jgi:hypothetical protein
VSGFRRRKNKEQRLRDSGIQGFGDFKTPNLEPCTVNPET